MRSKLSREVTSALKDMLQPEYILELKPERNAIAFALQGRAGIPASIVYRESSKFDSFTFEVVVGRLSHAGEHVHWKSVYPPLCKESWHGMERGYFRIGYLMARREGQLTTDYWWNLGSKNRSGDMYLYENEPPLSECSARIPEKVGDAVATIKSVVPPFLDWLESFKTSAPDEPPSEQTPLVAGQVTESQPRPQTSPPASTVDAIHALAADLRPNEVSEAQNKQWHDIIERVTRKRALTPEVEHALFALLSSNVPFFISGWVASFLENESKKTWMPYFESLARDNPSEVSRMHIMLVNLLEDEAVVEGLVYSAEAGGLSSDVVAGLQEKLAMTDAFTPDARLTSWRQRLDKIAPRKYMDYERPRQLELATQALVQIESTLKARRCFLRGDYKGFLRAVKDCDLDEELDGMVKVAREMTRAKGN